MKKNITVNIFGSLYPMDEDAYAMLNAYLLNMREFFSRKPDGKEIADDIEARAAELMTELLNSGTEAISIEHVNEIISRIGNPEEMNCELNENENIEVTTDETVSSDEVQSTKRKLFRDPEHKILGGVCAGLGSYLGINPLWLRLLGLILIIPSWGIIIALYIICWICIPMAITPAERLQMKGKPVTMPNICQEFLNSTREIIDRTGTFTSENGVSKGLASFIRWTLYSLGILLVVFCLIAILGVLMSLVSVVATPWKTLNGIVNDDFLLYAVVDSNPIWIVALCGASLLVMLILILFAGMHCALHLLGKVSPMNGWLRVACVVLWLAAFVIFGATTSNIVSNVGHRQYLLHRKSKKERAEETERAELALLENQGWNIVKSNNLRGGYTRSDKYYTGNDDVRYIHGGQKDNRKVMEYEVVKHLKVAPGVYKLRAAGRTDGKGAEIFAVNGSHTRYASPIPVCDNYGGSIWQNAKDALDADSLKRRSDRGYLKNIYKAHDKKGYGWSEIEVDNIVVDQDSIITYGVTNLSPSRVWEGTWFSATAFELEKTEKK